MWCVSAPRVITLLITLAGVVGAPDSTSTWIRSQPQQQTLHGLMVSIDERLQTLENSRWETTLKQMEQRLDSLESSIRRLDSSFQDRLDKLERNLNSKELKDELTVEKLSHKIRDILDSSYDRYNRRLGYTEERLEISLKKVQMNVETSLNRLEKQQEDVQSEVLEAVTLLEDIKSQSTTSEDKLNSTHKALQQHVQRLMSPSHEELQKISGSLEQLGSRLNSTLVLQPWGAGSQNDGPQAGDMLTSVRKEISSEGTKFSIKMNNMYNELWRKIMSVESMIKDMSRLTNTTQRDILDEVRSLVAERRDFPGDSQENFIEVALDALERKLQRKLLDLGRKVEDRLDTLSATQNLVMDSCFDGGICRGLEARLSQVLEKIFDVFSDKIDGFSNRTFDLDSLVLEMMELVKTQHSQLIRTVTHNTNMVVTLAKDSSDANKMLQQSLTQLADKAEYKFQELHGEIHNNSGKVCIDGDETLNQHLPHNITEATVSVLGMTQSSKNNTKKDHDAGVLKITTDDINLLADNGSFANQAQIKLRISPALAVDTSIMQIVGLMSPNLTDRQMDTLLNLLNSSVSVDSIEAIIQNTEADTEEEEITDGLVYMSMEVEDAEAFNRTNNDDDINIICNDTSIVLPLTKGSEEQENISDENVNQNEPTEIIMTQKDIVTDTEENETNKTESEPKSLEVPLNLKEQLRLYVLLLKIKQGNLNTTQLWNEEQQLSDQSNTHLQQRVLPIFQKLCFGDGNILGLTPEYINTVMRNRLLLIHNTINDMNLYDKIENVCNTITESHMSKNINERSSLTK